MRRLPAALQTVAVRYEEGGKLRVPYDGLPRYGDVTKLVLEALIIVLGVKHARCLEDLAARLRPDTAADDDRQRRCRTCGTPAAAARCATLGTGAGAALRTAVCI